MTINRNLVIRTLITVLLVAFIYIGFVFISPLVRGEESYRDKTSGISFRYPSYFGDPGAERSYTVFDSEKYRISFRVGSLSGYSVFIDQVKSDAGKDDSVSAGDLPGGLKSYTRFKISKERTGEIIAVVSDDKDKAVEIGVASKKNLGEPTDEATISEISSLKAMTDKILSSLKIPE